MKKTIATVDMEKVFSKVRVSFFPFTETANEFYGRPSYNYDMISPNYLVTIYNSLSTFKVLTKGVSRDQM